MVEIPPFIERNKQIFEKEEEKIWNQNLSMTNKWVKFQLYRSIAGLSGINRLAKGILVYSKGI